MPHSTNFPPLSRVLFRWNFGLLLLQLINPSFQLRIPPNDDSATFFCFFFYPAFLRGREEHSENFCAFARVFIHFRIHGVAFVLGKLQHKLPALRGARVSCYFRSNVNCVSSVILTGYVHVSRDHYGGKVRSVSRDLAAICACVARLQVLQDQSMCVAPIFLKRCKQRSK